MNKIKIDGEYIKLDSLLKLSNLAQSGGHAKY
jgi:ribosome-associated protein YbcJ (S4-like RNA binding protein)